MFNRLFQNWFQHIEEDSFQLGCRDRAAGHLPQRQDSVYVKGYLSCRPSGLDGEIQFFQTVEDYLRWKQRSPYR